MRPDPAVGVFETMLGRDGRVEAVELHVRRLASSVAELYDERLPSDLTERLLDMSSALTGPRRIRVDFIPGRPLTIESSAVEATPARTHLLKPRLIPGGLGPHKWRDRRALESDGTYVPLIVDADDDVLEAAWANVWIVEGDTVITPPADGRILPGVTRALLLDAAARHRLPAIEEPIKLARAEQADAIFLTSSIRHAVAAALGEQPAPHSPNVLAMISRWISLVPP